MSELYVRVMDQVYRLCIWIAGFCLLFMVFVYLFAIYARFRPDLPSWLGFLPYGSTSWPEPLSNICMISFSFIGAAAAYRAGGHISITMLTDHIGEKAARVLRKVVDVFMLVICLFIIVWGVMGCQDAWTDVIPSLPFLTSGMVHIPIPVGSFLTALFVIESLIAGPQNHRELVRFGSPSVGH